MKITDLQGTEILSATPYYENILISTQQGDKIVHYYLTPKQLVVILSEFDFKAITKRTRSWLELNINEWNVQKYDEPRS